MSNMAQYPVLERRIHDNPWKAAAVGERRVVTVSAKGITMRYPPGVGIGLKSTYREQWGSLAQGNALSKPAGDPQTRKGTRPSAYRNAGEV